MDRLWCMTGWHVRTWFLLYLPPVATDTLQVLVNLMVFSLPVSQMSNMFKSRNGKKCKRFWGRRGSLARDRKGKQGESGTVSGSQEGCRQNTKHWRTHLSTIPPFEGWSILNPGEEHRTMCLSVVFCILAKTQTNTCLHHTYMRVGQYLTSPESRSS